MSQSKEIIVSEVEFCDAESLQTLLNTVSLESDYLTRSETSPQMTKDDLQRFIEQQRESLNKICLVAKIEDCVIGVLNVASNSYEKTSHIGEIFVAVQKQFWGYGIGQLLLEAAIDWAGNSQMIRRLELTVQKRNERAVHIYQKYGFEIEGLKKRGAKSKDGEFIDVYAMARLID